MKMFSPLVSIAAIVVPGELVVTDVQVGELANGSVVYLTVDPSATYRYSVPADDTTLHKNRFVFVEVSER